MLEIDWCEIPAATLVMGQPVEDVRAVWEEQFSHLPWHYFAKQTGSVSVDVGAFWMARTPFTWQQLAEVAPELCERLRPGREPPDRPARGLTFEEAEHVCVLVSEAIGTEVEMPTEPQWERAARSDDDRFFPWGNDPPRGRCDLHSDQESPAAVGSFADGRSQHGVLDLAGGVDEWTSSVYEPYPECHWTVPQVESWAADPHVTRGGNWYQGYDLAWTRRRHAIYPPQTGAGFRVCAS